jgi:hypothetical protein
LAVQHCQLVAQDGDLDVLAVWFGTEGDQTEDVSYKKESKGGGHANDPGRCLSWLLRAAILNLHPSRLREALQHYLKGFLQIRVGYGGSHGTASVPTEFEQFGELFRQLRPDIKTAWLDQLRDAWHGETSLLARLEQLY